MASLRKRGSYYYVVFTRRVDGDLEQKVRALRTDSKRQAERLKFELEEKAERGAFDPFGAWDIRDHLEARRRRSRAGLSLEEVGERFLESRSHVSPATFQNYERRLERLKRAIGETMPVRLIEDRDVRTFCFQPHLSRASQRTYLRFCKMLFKWMAAEGYIDESPSEGIRYPRRKDKISGKTISETQLLDVLTAHKDIQREKILKGQRRGPPRLVQAAHGLRVLHGAAARRDNAGIGVHSRCRRCSRRSRIRQRGAHCIPQKRARSGLSDMRAAHA